MKDIRFSEKKIDESWKEQATRDRVLPSNQQQAKTQSAQTGQQPTSESGKKTPKANKVFASLLNSLGTQALMAIGEIPYPDSGTVEVNLDAAKEVIDLLNALKEKTEGNLSPEEEKFFTTFLPELQMKFSSKV